MTTAVNLAALGNGPAFLASGTSFSPPSNAVHTLVPYGTKTFDTNSRFNNTGSSVGGIPAYAFMPNVAGYYLVSGILQTTSQPGGTYCNLEVYVNGASYSTVASANSAAYPYLTGSILVYLNGTTDYVQIYQYQNGTPQGGTAFNFSGCLVRAA